VAGRKSNAIDLRGGEKGGAYEKAYGK